MAQDYSPSLVTKNLVFCGDAAMKSAAGPATLLYDKVNDNNGTMYNGTCFDFDGTDDKVVTNNAVVTGTGDFTFTAWINIASFASTNFICGNYGVGNTGGVELYTIAAGNKLRVHIVSGGINCDTSLVADTWYHVGVTRLAGVAQLYVNGAADGASGTYAGSIVGNNDFSIGNGEDYTSENMDGIIADVKAFNVALSAANMKELYDDSKVIIPTKNAAAGGFVSQTNLIGWWPLAEGAGDICYDGSGNGYHGIVSNEDGDEWLTGQTGCPQLVEGYNRPMSFDGSNDYVDITDGLTSGTNPVSISVWFNAISGNTYYPAWNIGNSYAEGICLHGTLNRLEGGAGASDTFDNSSFGNSLVDGAWHHILVTYDGSEIRKYEDGVYISGATFSSYGTWTASEGLGTPSNAEIASFWAGYFKGMVNEFIVYNSALVLADAAALAATGPNGGPLPPDPYKMSYSSGISSSNIVGYWRNDGDVTWTDRSGNGNNGTVAGSPDTLLFKQGYNGQKNVNTGRDGQGFPLKFKNVGAVGFNGVAHASGSGEYVSLGTCPTILEMAQTSETTILAWVKLDRQSVNNGIISAFSSTSYPGWSLCCYEATYNKAMAMLVSDGADGSAVWLRQYYDGGGGAVPAGKTPEMLVDRWYHVAVTISRISGTTSVYYSQDGVKNVTPVTNSSEGGSTGWGNGKELIIGRGAAGWGDFNGQIANVQIYKTILTDAEIQQNYNSFKNRFGK